MTVRNMNAYNFCRSIGINSSADQHVNLYNNVGLRRFRLPMNGNGSTVKSIGDAGSIPGYGVCAFADGYINLEAPLWNTGQQQAEFNTAANYVDFVEGPNEMNNLYVGNGSYDPTSGNSNLVTFTSSTGQQMYVNWCQAVFNFVQTSNSFPSGSGITGKRALLLAPPLAGGQSNDGGDPWSIVGSAAQNYFDLDPIHNYPPAQPFTEASGGGTVWDQMVNFGQKLGPGKQSIGSEIGHWTDTVDPGNGGDAVSETVHAKVLLNAWCDLINYGNPCMFIYTWNDGSPYGSGGGDQPYYGIFRSDGSTKVVARALKNILSLVNDTNVSFTPPSYQTINVSGIVTPPNHLPAPAYICAAKSDGSFWYVLWNEPNVGGIEGADTTPADNFITVDFNGVTCTWSIYDPLQPLVYFNGTDVSQNTLNNVGTTGTTPVSTGTGTALPSNSLNLVGYPKLLKLVPQLATSAPGTVTLSSVKTTATTQTLNWTTATNQPSDYIVTVTELT